MRARVGLNLHPARRRTRICSRPYSAPETPRQCPTRCLSRVRPWARLGIRSQAAAQRDPNQRILMRFQTLPPSWRPTSARFVVTPGLVGVQLRQGLWSHQLRNSETPRVLIIGNKRAHHASAHPALPSPARDCDIPDGRVVWNLALPRSRATVGGRRSESVGLQAGHRNADTRKDTGANHW